MTPGRNPLFSGRGADLKRIAAALKTGRTVALAGPDGVGKTELATEFAHRFGQFFAGGVFWVSFTNPIEIALEVAACGGPGAMDLRGDYGELALDDQLHLVLRAWHRHLHPENPHYREVDAAMIERSLAGIAAAQAPETATALRRACGLA